MLGLAEILTGPARAGDLALVGRYADEVLSLDGFDVRPMDHDVAVEAALARGRSALTLSDAVHLASARLQGASAFVTNDHRIRPIRGLEVVYLDQLQAT